MSGTSSAPCSAGAPRSASRLTDDGMSTPIFSQPTVTPSYPPSALAIIRMILPSGGGMSKKYSPVMYPLTNSGQGTRA